MTHEDMIKGFKIMSNYSQDKGGYLESDHEIIWTACDENPDDMNPDDVKELERLGFHWDDDCECWACYT